MNRAELIVLLFMFIITINDRDEWYRNRAVRQRAANLGLRRWLGMPRVCLMGACMWVVSSYRTICLPALYGSASEAFRYILMWHLALKSATYFTAVVHAAVHIWLPRL